MNKNKNTILTDNLRRLLRRKANKHLSKIINKTHIADIAIAFLSLHITEQKKLYELIETLEKKGLLLIALEDDHFVDLIKDMDIKQIAQIFENIPADDVADLIAKLSEEKADSILNAMKKEGSEEVEDLLRYKDDSAGGIMSTDFIAIKENLNAKETIELLQSKYSDVDVAFYLYVINEYNHLVGVVSLRQLVVEHPDTKISKFMTTDVFFVKTDMDQEEVAKIVARYDILAVPVVNENRELVGIVTVDDVIDIIKQEATEDILKMGGVGSDDFIETQTIIKSTQKRSPWLLASCLGGIAAFFIIGHFEQSLIKYTFLAAFIPIIMGMGGNVGTQSSTIVVRGLATGRINVNDILSVVFKELSIGVILGIIYGILIATIAHIKFPIEYFSIVIVLAVLSSMSIAALVGSFIPMFFARLNIDPAIATGPFVTTAIDIISVFLYFTIATILLGI